MSTLTKLKQNHLAAADTRWEQAVEGARPYFHYRRPEVRELARLFLTVPHMIRLKVFGQIQIGKTWKLYALGTGFDLHTPCGTLELLSHFIGYQILDDGDPGVGWMRFDSHKGYVPCSPKHKHAEPYFHQSIEMLQKKDPTAKRLYEKEALWVLEWHLKERERTNKFRKSRPDLYDEDDLDNLSPTDLDYIALADELSKEG